MTVRLSVTDCPYGVARCLKAKLPMGGQSWTIGSCWYCCHRGVVDGLADGGWRRREGGRQVGKGRQQITKVIENIRSHLNDSSMRSVQSWRRRAHKNRHIDCRPSPSQPERSYQKLRSTLIGASAAEKCCYACQRTHRFQYACMTFRTRKPLFETQHCAACKAFHWCKNPLPAIGQMGMYETEKQALSCLGSPKHKRRPARRRWAANLDRKRTPSQTAVLWPDFLDNLTRPKRPV